MCAFITVMEFSASRRRGMMGSAVWLFSPFIFSMIALFAYLIREWRYLLLVGATLGTPVMIYIWWVLSRKVYYLVDFRSVIFICLYRLKTKKISLLHSKI